MATMKDSLSVFLVIENDKVDFAASKARFEKACLDYIARHEGETTFITQCLNQLFDDFPGSNINAQGVASMTIQRMARKVPELGNPGQFGVLSKRVLEVLKELTGDTDDKPFGIQRGPKGGHYRKADQAPKA